MLKVHQTDGDGERKSERNLICQWAIVPIPDGECDLEDLVFHFVQLISTVLLITFQV
jgi:hypothetical protein